MAKGFKHGAGGGTSLNFKVAGGTSAPSNPKENTIWVNTGNEITAWAFSADEPSITKNIVKEIYSQPTVNAYSMVLYIDAELLPNTTYTLSFEGAAGNVYYVNENIAARRDVVVGNGRSSVRFTTKSTLNKSDTYQFDSSRGKWMLLKNAQAQSKAHIFNNVQVEKGSSHDGIYVPYVIEGCVWFSAGTSSTAPFNALKKNGITVYPMSAKQYINGAWVNKPIKVYQSGSWKDALLYTVVPNTGITWSKEKNVTVTQNADSTVFSHGAGDGTVHYADFSVDLTPYTKLKIVGNVSASAASDSNSVKISIGAFSTNASFVTGFTKDIYNRDGTININNTYDISSLSGIYLIRYNARRNNDASSSHTCKFIATSIELS